MYGIIKKSGLHWFHWVVVCGSLLLTLFAWDFSRTQMAEKAHQQFDQEASQLIELVTERMQKYEEALLGGVAMIRTKQDVITYRDWKRYAGSLGIEKRYPGINGIGVIYHVLPEGMPEFLAKEKAIRPDFHLHPKHEKDEFWPITYIEPEEMNRQAVGLDMAFETNRYTAAEKARDTGTTQMTAPIVLVQDSEKTPGFLVYAPFYKNGQVPHEARREADVLGLVYAPFIMKNLMKGTLEQTKRRVMLSITDGGDMLYNELVSANADYDPSPTYTAQKTIVMFGRPWKFDIRSGASFNDSTQNDQPKLILAGGILVDGLLFALFIMMGREKARSSADASEARSKLVNNEIKTETVVSSMIDGVIVIDAHGIVEEFNQAAARLFQYRPDEVIGQNIKMLMPEPHRGAHDGYLANYLSTGKRRIIGINREINAQRKDGSLFPIELAISEMVIDGRRLFSGLIRDITERKLAETESKTLTEKLIHSNAELERFAYVASHDLQEPLRKILAFSEMLDESMAAGDQNETDYALGVLQASAKRARSLIQDLLSYSRVQNSGIEIAPVDLKAVVQSVLDDLSLLIDQQEATVEMDMEPVSISADRNRLQMLINNLVGNALKYHAPDRPNKIEIIGNHADSDTYVLTIRDTGIGFEPEFRESIFEPFSRLHGKSVYEGSGIGLAICKSVCDSHDWMIDAVGVAGEGATFTIAFNGLIAANSSGGSEVRKIAS